MRYILNLILIMVGLAFSGEFKLKYWDGRLSFADYLRKNHINSRAIYAKLHPDDRKYLDAIGNGEPFFENKRGKKLIEALIPLGEKMQIYLHKKGSSYTVDIVPIEYKTIKNTFSLTIKNNCYADIQKRINNGNIANHLKKIFRNHINFSKLNRGDKIVVSYEQKSIKGIPWGEPTVKSAYIRHKNKEYFAILKGSHYKVYTSDKNYKVIIKRGKKRYYSRFHSPLPRLSVSSRFTYKRWHPILHRYRPHLGVDLRARRGTPIYSVASGRVIYAGWLGGYGKVTKIDHGNGVVSLYAHQSKILVRRGQRVRKGQLIGRVGSTGRSTGPHLHLGMYKRGRPVNPMSYINRRVAVKRGYRRKVIKVVKNLSKHLSLKEKRVYNRLKRFSNHTPYVWRDKREKVKITVKVKDVKRVELSGGEGDYITLLK
jgi:murein DD-endopeptidase MepM/ murein hydrolase activator NlpD